MKNQAVSMLDLTKKLKKTRTEILKNITLTIETGEFVAIMGPSGSGKSTLLNIIAGLDEQYDGSVTVADVDLNNQKENQLANFRNKQLGIVFQDYNLLSDLTAIDNVLLPTYFSKVKVATSRATELLQSVGLTDEMLTKAVSELSGGEQQRVAIARALIQQPKLLLADEPTGALDHDNSHGIMQLFKQINRDNKMTIIMVTHDVEMVQYCDRIIHLLDGEVLNEVDI